MTSLTGAIAAFDASDVTSERRARALAGSLGTLIHFGEDVTGGGEVKVNFSPSFTTERAHFSRGKRAVQRGRKGASRDPTGIEGLLGGDRG